MAKILIIAGISGSGKSTISDALMERHSSITRAVAVTTRLPRAGEKYAYHYYFVDHERFEWLVQTDQLLEHTTIYNNHRYGTLKLSVEQALERGHDVLFVVDSHGVEQISAVYPDAKSVFLKAPSEEEQRNRLLRRGTMGDELDERVAAAERELEWAQSRGMTIVTNDRVERALIETEKALGY